MMRRIGQAMAVLAVLVAGVEVSAQVLTPSYQSPRLLNEVGVYVSDGPGDLAAEGVWRRGPLGLRGGVADIGEDLSALVGAEFRHAINTPGSPLRLAFLASAQGLFGDADGIGIGAGVTIGHTFISPGLALTPYLHPRVAFVEIEDQDDTELLAELGFDAEFSPSLSLRLGLELGDGGADFGVGVSWRQR